MLVHININISIKFTCGQCASGGRSVAHVDQMSPGQRVLLLAGPLLGPEQDLQPRQAAVDALSPGAVSVIALLLVISLSLCLAG